MGKHLSPETIEKIRKANSTPEHIALMRKLHTGNKYTLGRKHTEEEKQKIRQSMLGHYVSAETRRRMSLALFKRYQSLSKEQRIKLRNKNKSKSKSL